MARGYKSNHIARRLKRSGLLRHPELGQFLSQTPPPHGDYSCRESWVSCCGGISKKAPKYFASSSNFSSASLGLATNF